MTLLNGEETKRVCPYCDEETEGGSQFCKPCEVTFIKCTSCEGLVATDVKVCPHCGAAVCIPEGD